MNGYFDNCSPDYAKYCSVYSMLGCEEIIPNITSDFIEGFEALVQVLKMKPKAKFLENYLNKVVLGLYNCSNMTQYNLSHYFLNGPLRKMCDSKGFNEMRQAWNTSMTSLSGKFHIHSSTLALVEKIITSQEKVSCTMLDSSLRGNINDLLYCSYFFRCTPLKDVSTKDFLLIAKEMISPGVDDVFKLEKLLTDENLPNQLVVRLCGTFFVMRKELKICVKRSILLLGYASSESKMSMMVLQSPIEFQNQTSLARIHFLKERNLEFALRFNYTQGISSKCLLSSVVVEGGGIFAQNYEEFAMLNSMVQDCNIAVYAKKIDYFFLGDRDAPSQTLFASRCTQCLQAEDLGNCNIANIMVQDTGGVLLVGPCNLFEMCNVSIVDCGRMGVVSCASPVQLSGCSIACKLPHLDTTGHGIRFSMVSLSTQSTFPMQDIPVLCTPMMKLQTLNFQPDHLTKRQKIEVPKVNIESILKKYNPFAEIEDPRMVVNSGIQEMETFQPVSQLGVTSSNDGPSIASIVKRPRGGL